jgi:hypothetical protein
MRMKFLLLMTVLALTLTVQFPFQAQDRRPPSPQPVEPMWPDLRSSVSDSCSFKCGKLCDHNPRCLTNCYYVCRANEKKERIPEKPKVPSRSPVVPVKPR